MFKFTWFKKKKDTHSIPSKEDLLTDAMKDKLIKYELNRLRKEKKGKPTEKATNFSPCGDTITNIIVQDSVYSDAIEYDETAEYYLSALQKKLEAQNNFGRDDTIFKKENK